MPLSSSQKASPSCGKRVLPNNRFRLAAILEPGIGSRASGKSRSISKRGNPWTADDSPPTIALNISPPSPDGGSARAPTRRHRRTLKVAGMWAHFQRRRNEALCDRRLVLGAVPRRVVWRRGRPGHEARRGGRYRGVACPRSSTQHKNGRRQLYGLSPPTLRRDSWHRAIREPVCSQLAHS